MKVSWLVDAKLGADNDERAHADATNQGLPQSPPVILISLFESIQLGECEGR